MIVASDEPTVVAAAGEGWTADETPDVWQVTERDAEQAAESLAAEHAYMTGQPVPGLAYAGDAGEAGAAWQEGDAEAWDDGAEGIEHIDAYDELAEGAVSANPLQDAAQFVVDLLARAGLTESDGEFDEQAFDAQAFEAPAMPARLFDHFSGRRHVLPDALARRFHAVALPGEPVGQLAAGDWLLRRGEGGLGHVAVLASPRVWPLPALRRNGFTVEQDKAGGFVHVIEPGFRASLRDDRFARRLTDPGQRVLPDTLVLRPQAPRPQPRVRFDSETLDEAVDGRWIQDALNRILGISLAVDGQIGPQSRAAIRSFQQQRGLAVDGVVGPRTEAALRDALGGGGSTPANVRSGGGTSAGAGSPVGNPDCTTLDSFDQGRDTLQPAHHTLLVGVARRIQREGIRVAIVTGFASSEGDDVSNLTLGQRRADNVARTLRETLERTRPGSSSGVAMPTFSRGENDQVPGGDRARNRRVTVCLTPRPVRPPPPPVQPAQTKLFTITGKSFIARIGGNRGSLDCGIDIGPVRIPGASNAGLFALARATDLAFSENPGSDRISTAPPPDNKGYRLFSQGRVQAQHRGTHLLNVSVGSGLTIDAGRECAGLAFTCLSPPIVIDQAFVTQRIDASRIRFRWGVKGRPDPKAEAGFQAICQRDSVFIWHLIKGEIDASSGVPQVTSLIIEGSRFPSHRVWLDNVAKVPHVAQGPMSNLWDSAAGDPSRVR